MINSSMANAIDSNKTFGQNVLKSNSSNKSYLLKAYDTDRVLFYNDPKKKKKSKWKRNLALAFSASVALSCVALALLRGVNLNKIKEYDAHQIIQRGLATLSNFTTIKDDLWDKLAKKCKDMPVLKYLDKGGEKITQLYRNLVYQATKGNYQKAYSEVMENLNGARVDIDDFDTYFKKINGTILDTVKKEGKRPTDGLFKKGFFDRVTRSNLADALIDETDVIKDAYSAKVKIPDGANSKLIEKINNFNEVKLSTSGKLIPKLRDINVGSAPTDVITILASLGLFGGAMVTADNKEERKSLALNLGIPLLSSLTTTTIGIAKCYSGASALIFGFASGKILTNVLKLVINKHHHDKNTKSA